MRQEIEREFKFLFDRYEYIKKFINYKNNTYAKWEKDFLVERTTIWFDDLEYTLKSKGLYFSLVLNSSLIELGKNKFKLKVDSPGLSEDELLEFSYEFDSHLNYKEQMDIFWEKIPTKISQVYSNLCQSIEPVMYTKQSRHKRSLLINNKRLFVSADICRFFDPITNIFLGEKYICELESGKETGMLTREDITPLINYIIDECQASPLFNSKLDIGLAMSENSEWENKVSLNEIEQLLSLSVEVIKDRNSKKYHSLYNKILFLENECYKEKEYHDFLPKISTFKSIFFLLINNKKHNMKYLQLGAISKEYSNYLAKLDNLEIALNEERILIFKRKMYNHYLSSRNVEVRKNIYEFINNELKILSIHLIPIIYNAQQQSKKMVYDSYVGSESTYNYFKFYNRKYMLDFLKKYQHVNTLRAKYLDNYSIYDIQCPILIDGKSSFLEIKKKVKYSIQKYSEKYTKMFYEFFERKQIHYTAASIANITFSNELNEPLVSVIKTGNGKDLLSFAHELGHAIAIKSLPEAVNYDNIPELIQELHSNLMEIIVINNNSDRDEVIELYLEKYRAGFIRQQMISEFEYIIDSGLDIKNYLTDINQLYKKYFDSVKLPRNCEYEFLKNQLLVNRPFISEIYSTSFVLANYFFHSIEESKFTLEEIFVDSLSLPIKSFFDKYDILKNYHQMLEIALSDYSSLIESYEHLLRRNYHD